MKHYTHIFKVPNGAMTFLFLLFSLIIQAQNNTWIENPKGDNPWGTESSSSNKNEGSKKSLSQTKNSSPTYVIVDENFASKNSNDTVRYFNINDTIIALNTESYNYYSELRYQGKDMHKANLALGMGIASASFISILALPINMVASAIPTPLVRHRIKQFKADNPHATKKEVNAIRMGISGKRFSNALIGVGVGCAVNLTAIIAITAVSIT